MSTLLRLDEWWALLKLKYVVSTVSIVRSDNASLNWCYDMLPKTSRSFSMVILQLSEELRDVVCIFYLVLRGLDTIEDDTSYPKLDRIRLLKDFSTFLYQPNWTLDGCGEKYEKELLNHFDKVIDVFLSLKESYQEIIRDITQRMGNGMAEFITRDVSSLEDWNLYCHYVAGLVGIGLTRMFAASGLEETNFERIPEQLANSMGLFLQKTNITRDYLEDINQNRIFWPKEVWKLYAERLEDFRQPQNATHAVHCLNHLVTDALKHMLDCLDYMREIHDPGNFAFCAIPQVMAIATLALCYNNHNVFTGVVKIRRGESAKIVLRLRSGGYEALSQYFFDYARQIESKISHDDPNQQVTLEIIERIKQRAAPKHELSRASAPLFRSVVLALVFGSVYFVFQRARPHINAH